MYGNNFGAGNNLSERITDDWINRNVPGGVNSMFIFTFIYLYFILKVHWVNNWII